MEFHQVLTAFLSDKREGKLRQGHTSVSALRLRRQPLPLPSLAGRSILYKQWAPLRRLVSEHAWEIKRLWKFFSTLISIGRQGHFVSGRQ